MTTQRSHLTLALLLSVLSVACSKPTIEVQLNQVSGVREGSRVEASGIEIGAVTKMTPSGAGIRYQVELSRTDIQIASDACALPPSSDAQDDVLQLQLGEGSNLAEGAVIPQCAPSLLDSANDALVDLIRRGSGVIRGASEAALEGAGVTAEEAGRQAREQIQGFHEGLTAGDPRGTARALGETVGEWEQGLAEGLVNSPTQPQPQPTQPQPQPTNPQP